MSQEQAMPTNGPWGWYIDHDGRFERRASKLLEYGETKPGTYHLRAWSERQVLEGVAQRDDLILAAKALGRVPETGWTKDQKKTLDSLVETAKAAAKSRDGGVEGTAVHTLTERIDRGEDIESVVSGLPAGMAFTLRAYEAMRRLNGWESVEIERTVWLEELEVRGTFDRVDLVPGLTALLGPANCQYGHEHGVYGTEHAVELPVIVDVKTEKDPSLNGIHIAPQLATYSRARKMWRPTGGMRTVTVRGEDREVPNGEYVPAPCVRQDVAIVVHLRDGDSNSMFVNLISGWRAAVRFYEQMKDEQAAKRRIGAVGAWFAPVPNVKQPAPGELLVANAVARGEGRPDRPEAGDTRSTAPVAATGSVDGWATHAPAGPVQHEVAVRGADGLVRWEPEHTVGDTVTVAGVEFVKHSEPGDPAGESRAYLIRSIWEATTLERLAELWSAAAAHVPPVSWSGPVAMAGDARRRQIECVQRALHIGIGTKCACGWTTGIPA